MTQQRLSEILKLIRWGPSALAAETGVSERTVRRWVNGQSPMPERFDDWLEGLAAIHLANPPPSKW